MDLSNQLWHGDCLELMKDIPDRSVDMILGDIPYGTTAHNWDSVINLDLMWGQFKRIIKKNRAIVMTATQPFTSILVTSNLEWFRWEDIWDKKLTTGFLDANRRPLRRHENILVFSDGLPMYNPQMTKGKPYKNKKRLANKKTQSGAYQDYTPKNKVNNGDRYPTSIIEISNANRRKTGHPTEKELKLFLYLVRTYSNPGDLIFDPTCGSGTSAIAAIETGRRWLCIEKSPDLSQPISKDNPDYYGMAKGRIEERLLTPILPGIEQGKRLELIEADQC